MAGCEAPLGDAAEAALGARLSRSRPAAAGWNHPERFRGSLIARHKGPAKPERSRTTNRGGFHHGAHPSTDPPLLCFVGGRSLSPRPAGSHQHLPGISSGRRSAAGLATPLRLSSRLRLERPASPCTLFIARAQITGVALRRLWSTSPFEDALHALLGHGQDRSGAERIDQANRVCIGGLGLRRARSPADGRGRTLAACKGSVAS